MPISFSRLVDYLDKIGDAVKPSHDPANAGHKVFWHLNYQAFITGTIPNKHCLGQNVPIIDPVNKVNSAFYQILKGKWCNMPQMPVGGPPFVTDPGYTITLNDGTIVTGTQLLADIEEWLAAGAPEK